MASVEIRGAQQLAKKLQSISEKMEDRVLAQGLRTAGNLLRRNTRAAAPVRSGRLKRRIMGKLIRENRRVAAFRVKAGTRYAHIVTGGTRPHDIWPKRASVLASQGTIYGMRVHHPGSKANPFVDRARSAHLSEAQAIVKAAMDSLIRSEI